MATTKTQVPSIPAIPKNEREAEAFNNSIKEILEVRLGRRGDPKDRAVTLRELIDSGLAKELLDNPFDPNAGAGVTDFASSSTFVDGKLDDTNDLTAPPTPTGLAASAGTTKIILNWNFAQISNLAHTEVWRSSDNNLSNAVRHDTTEAFVWVDSVDPGDEFYYWIRHVTTAGIFSQFAGSVNATTVLIAGTKIAADAITETKIADDAITTPKILTNAVTSDSIAGATITAGNIGANELTSASGIFGTLDASEMSITNLNASNITTGTLDAGEISVINLSAGSITSGNMTADRITAGSLNVAGKAVTGSVGTVVASASVTDSQIPDDIGVHNYLTTYWASSPFHAFGTDYVHIPTDTSGNKTQVGWTTPNWTDSAGGSATKKFIVTGSLNATGQLVGDGRAENLTAIAVRQTTSATGYQSSTASDFILSTSIVRAAGDHVLGSVILTGVVDLLPNTTYYAWLFHGISDYGPTGSSNGGAGSAMITVQGLGI